jgi:hypothetical protein
MLDRELQAPRLGLALTMQVAHLHQIIAAHLLQIIAAVMVRLVRQD